MYMCVGLRERMSYGMYCTCIIGTRRSKSALPIKTCWILWIPNPVTLFCLSTSPFFFYCLSTRQWNRGMDTVIFASNNMSGMQSQFRENNKMIKLILFFMQQFAELICAVRQSQSRHSVSGCHIRHCLALSVAGDCVCVCVCVCVRVCVKPPWVYFWWFLKAMSCCRRKQGWQSSGSALISPSQEGYHSPFLPLTAASTQTHTYTPSHCHRRQQCQQLIFMHLNPYPCGPWMCLWVSGLRNEEWLHSARLTQQGSRQEPNWKWAEAVWHQ